MKRPTAFRVTLNVLVLALLVLALGVSWNVTEIDFPGLIRKLPNGEKIITEVLSPDIFTRNFETTTIELPFAIPCGSAPDPVPPSSGPRLIATPACADEKTSFTLEGFDLSPNAEIVIRWQFPDGRVLTAARTVTDADGHFSTSVDAKPIAKTVGGIPSKLQVDTNVSVGGLKPSQAAQDVMREMFVTIFMALLSTTIATIIAAPLSFLAAGNIMRRGVVGTTVYYIFRSFFNLMRSYDPLVMATVFAFWLGYGPFAGMLALTVVTIASLGKLFSEAIESIDTGPIEAVTATGAPRLHTVVYSVIPQVVPDFISFIIYHWDINVRISTIIGYVGGGGIGYYLSQRINTFAYHQAGTAIFAIVIVVWAMDFLSAEVRKRLT
jgi:phosphonate transport system permease protein